MGIWQHFLPQPKFIGHGDSIWKSTNMAIADSMFIPPLLYFFLFISLFLPFCRNLIRFSLASLTVVGIQFNILPGFSFHHPSHKHIIAHTYTCTAVRNAQRFLLLLFYYIIRLPLSTVTVRVLRVRIWLYSHWMDNVSGFGWTEAKQGFAQKLLDGWKGGMGEKPVEYKAIHGLSQAFMLEWYRLPFSYSNRKFHPSIDYYYHHHFFPVALSSASYPPHWIDVIRSSRSVSYKFALDDSGSCACVCVCLNVLYIYCVCSCCWHIFSDAQHSHILYTKPASGTI